MVSVKFSMSSTSVNVLMFIEKLQVTQILALVGGYLGIWLGLSIRTFAILLVDWCFERLRRLQRSKYAAAEVSSVARFVRLVVEATCLVLCVRNSLADVHHYWRFPASVVYNEDQHVRFPVLTLCFPDGYNKSGMHVHQEVEAPLDIGGNGDATMQFNADHLKNLIEQAYPPQDMILHCRMKARSDLCRDFECRKLWKVAYTYVLHTVCYSMDFDLTVELREPETAFDECPEPWKYRLEMTVNAGRDPMGNQVIMATVHDSGSFSGGLPRTIMMTATHRYVISTKQTDVFTLPPPYETACIDYHRLNDTKTRTGFSKTQDKECEDTCIQHVWEKLCGCVSANYMLRHTIDAPVCSTVERFTCWSDASRKEKLRECRTSCRRPCGTSVYAATIFGSDHKDAQPHEIYVVLLLGSYRRKIIESRPMLTGDTLFSYLEGHIGMWLGLTLFSAAGLAAGLYRTAADFLPPLLATAAPRRA
ncbi:uncharacterized protein LOC119445245 [Dermacentor silvarum]|uniref:uncharacterized protein LOC119445245 n=1 Tax=Dermacentor silvarum TaxID=543639 RepID=UPI002100A3DF|nr:uncharacterized protein LOC119445245 [Dermacentor silvarum]